MGARVGSQSRSSWSAALVLLVLPDRLGASASAVTQRRNPRLGSCDHGTGPKPFQPLRRSASSPRW
jgi:hypothetical protein